MRHHNNKYDSNLVGGFPLSIGDRQWAQDYHRDFRWMQSEIGKALENVVGETNTILSGLNVSQGTGTTFNIKSGKALVEFNVTIPDPNDAWTVPPTPATEDIYCLTEILSDIADETISGWTAGTTNYVKLAYAEEDGNTRDRVRKEGSYSYEVNPSYVLTCDTVEPTNYEIELARFTESGGTFTFDHSYRDQVNFKLNKIEDFRLFPYALDQVGNDSPVSTVAEPSIAALSSSSIAFIDATNKKLGTYSWDGTDWLLSGNELDILSIGNPSIAALSSSSIAFIDSTNKKLGTYSWDGTDWLLSGNELDISDVGDSSICSLDSSTIAFIDSTNEDLRIYSWDGTDWLLSGNELNISGIANPSICSLNSSTIVFIDSANKNLGTYSWNGTDLILIGNELNISGASYPSICSLNSSTIVLIDSTNKKLGTYSWDGIDWTLVDNNLSISSIGNPSIAALSSNTIAFIDDSNDDLRVYNFEWKPKTPFERF